MALSVFVIALLIGTAYSQYGSMSPAPASPAGSPPASTPSGSPPATPSGSPPASPSGSPPATSAPVTSAPVTSGPVTSAPSPSGASCSPVAKSYPNLSGEDLYKQLLSDLAVQEVAINNIAKANPNAPMNNSSGFYLSTLLQVNQANLQLQSITNGQTPSFTQCLNTAQLLGQVIGQVEGNANGVIPGASCDQLTGEGKYQYVLQQLGSALLNLLAQANLPANANNQYPGPWLTVVLNLNQSINRVQKVVMNNDASQECINASTQLASALKGILASNGVSIS